LAFARGDGKSLVEIDEKSQPFGSADGVKSVTLALRLEE
jgi:hypothetical protein